MGVCVCVCVCVHVFVCVCERVRVCGLCGVGGRRPSSAYGGIRLERVRGLVAGCDGDWSGLRWRGRGRSSVGGRPLALPRITQLPQHTKSMHGSAMLPPCASLL